MICDAQVHIWEGDRAGAPVPGEPWPHRVGPFGADELSAEMAQAGVDRAILIPPSAQGDRNDVALAAAAHFPQRFAVVGRLAFDDPASRSALPGWKQQPGMLGVRVTLSSPEQRARLEDGTMAWFWTAAETHDIPVMVMVPGNAGVVDAIARAHPGLRIIIDHLGRISSLQDAAAFEDLPVLLELARHPNVAVKATALPRFSSEPYPYRNLHPYIRRVFDAFGPQRVMWGTDLSRMRCPYRDAVTMVTEEMPFLSVADREWIMGRTACTWLGWP